MKKENEIILKSNFSLLYRKVFPFGFECGDGWLEILLELSRKIDLEFKSSAKNFSNYPVATQVKSKFAMLCWYGENLTDTMEESINEACETSRTTCEVCGTKGQVLIFNRWYYVYCDKHAPVGSQPPNEYKKSIAGKKRIFEIERDGFPFLTREPHE